MGQVPDIGTILPKDDPTAAGRIIQFIILLTVLSVAQGLLIMVTSFTRFVVALTFIGW